MIELQHPDIIGRDAYIISRMGQGIENSRDAAKLASDKLLEKGIRGIQYLDAGSRGAANVNDLRGTVSMLTSAVNKNPSDDYLWSQLEKAEAELKKAESGLSRNYVVFDPQHIRTERRYAKGGTTPDDGIVAYAFGDSVPHVQDRLSQLPDAAKDGDSIIDRALGVISKLRGD